MTVSDWARQWKAGELRQLRCHKSSGRPSKLTRQQRRKLKHRLRRGALAAGFPTDRWTLRCVQLLIQRLFGVRYHLNYLNRLLRRPGFSLQRPLPRATERDDEKVEAWLEHDWLRARGWASSSSTAHGHKADREA